MQSNKKTFYFSKPLTVRGTRDLRQTFIHKGEVEIWEDVNGFEGRYQVSTMGNVRSLDRIEDVSGKGKRADSQKSYKGKVLINKLSTTGYPQVNLCFNGNRKTVSIHRLVAEAFIDNPNNYNEVNHIDGNKKNNNVSNLEWCSSSYNHQHAAANGLLNPRKGHFNELSPKSKRICQYNLDGSLIQVWPSGMEVQRVMGFKQSSISDCALQKQKTAYGFIWKHYQTN